MKSWKYSIGLLLAATVLTACQPKPSSSEESTQPSTEQVTKTSVVASSESSSSATAETSSTETSSSSQPEIALSSVYQEVVNLYQSAIGLPAENIDQEQVSSYLALTQEQGTYDGAFYSLYDVNHDGVEELLIALKKSGEYTLIDLYTQLGDGSLLRLVDNFRAIGPEIGQEVALYPLEDGTYLYEGEGVFRIYQFNANIPGLKRVSETATAPETASKLDLTSLTWAGIQ